MPKILVSIVTYNSEVYIEDCLKSLFSQEARTLFSDFQVVLVDNASRDGTLRRVVESGLPVEIIRNQENKGFAAAHNQAFRLARDRGVPLVLIVNPDIVFTQSCVADLLRAMEANGRAGSVGPKLLRAGNEKRILDSTGLRILKNRKVEERGSGEEDRDRYKEEEEIFGVSGALALYRVAALEEAKIGEEYFDEDFFAYKEDVDLAWRLRLLGWKAIYVPKAIAYHHRGIGSFGGSDWNVAAERKGRSELAARWSYRNHFFTLLKNEQCKNFFLHAPHIIFFETKKFFYLLFFETKTLVGLADLIRLLPKVLQKRKKLHRRARIPAGEMRKWMG